MTRRVVGDVDWERLEAEFADADAEFGAAASLADRILAAVKARRARRRVLSVVAGTMIAAGLVVSVLLAVLPGGAPAGPETATRVQIYAAALTRVATSSGAPASDAARPHFPAAAAGGGAAIARPTLQQIQVNDHVCRGVPASTSSCTGDHLPRGVQRQLVGLPGAPVRFVAKLPIPRPNAPAVQFGRLVVHGERAKLDVDVRWGPRCGGWQTVRLRKEAGNWRLIPPVPRLCPS